MKYFKIIDGNYILSVGTGIGGVEITEQEYNEILHIIHNKPQATRTTDYNLKTDLSWEAYTIEPVEIEPTAEEIINILTGENND